jgi:hypothetical protein
MPNKTIYVKEADIPIFESTQEELGESVSSLFAEFLRNKLAAQTADEKKALDLVKQIRRDKKEKKAEGAGAAVLSEYNEAEAYAVQVWRLLQNGEFVAARNLFIGAQSYHNIANRTAQSYRNISRELARILGGPRPQERDKH